MDWFTFDGGGDTSTGGGLTVRGTVGQPDVGYSCGGSFTVEGGLWAAEEVSLPRLTVQPTGNNVVLVWPAALKYSGFVLQEADSLSKPIVWTPVNAVVNPINGFNRVTVPAATSARFYRLRK